MNSKEEMWVGPVEMTAVMESFPTSADRLEDTKELEGDLLDMTELLSLFWRRKQTANVRSSLKAPKERARWMDDQRPPLKQHTHTHTHLLEKIK